MSIIEGARKVIEGEAQGGQLKWARGDYSFAADGGAVGDVVLAAGVIPSGALILACYLEVDTAPTSGGGATIALKAEGAGDLQAAAAISGAPWSTTGRKVGSQTFTTAPLKTTARRDLVATIGTAALTAGAFKVLVAYLEAP
jgi:hypothetical protein